MMQPAIFNRLSNNTLFVLKLFVIGFFIGTIVLPLSKVHADNFTCVKKSIGDTFATLTITESAAAYSIDTADFVLADSNNSGFLITPHGVHPVANNPKQQSYDFEQLKASTAYRVIARDGNDNFLEEMTDCNFTTAAAKGGSTTTTTPVATTTTPPAEGNTQTPAAPTVYTPTPFPNAALNVPPVSVGEGGSGLIPCDGPECDLNSVLQLLNNLMSFFFRTLLLPIFVAMVMYLGFSYLQAGGSPGKHAKIGSMAKHMVLGLLLMLCAWVIVRTILSLIGYQDDLLFFAK
jgi:hypothetical protein